ncbi:MAG: 50S ribosomal protein L13 [Candidatus Spechtbacteria bacterium RIFCSPLOWO2_02_FULL_38_8]|uniref:Large ribosomal subunit protein uL13 n=1 Tax=Candidatus Spechtbacteria bacterium RIFCSPLOWO2_02_FULL_38_8 TaxID=1802164 RepID=A0A1G2HG35_9BACT|nr:MAG: 50S ribosomal protein L13 [Candidatus Spechtbacteria bacterium RIFCSPLOWO2_02_FULL_38_8]
MPTKTKKNINSKAEIIELDAENQVLGRLAVQAAKYLQGKHRTDYQPNKSGETVVKIKNAKKIEITGKKETDKMYWSHSGYAGGLYGRTYKEVFKKSPQRVIEYAVSGMLPKNKLRRERMKRLIIEL